MNVQRNDDYLIVADATYAALMELKAAFGGGEETSSILGKHSKGLINGDEVKTYGSNSKQDSKAKFKEKGDEDEEEEKEEEEERSDEEGNGGLQYSHFSANEEVPRSAYMGIDGADDVYAITQGTASTSNNSNKKKEKKEKKEKSLVRRRK